MGWEPFEQPDLFGNPLGAPVTVLRGALEPRFAAHQLKNFAYHIGVEQLEAVMGGKVYPVPRLEAWYGTVPYRFGGRTVQPRSQMPIALAELAAQVEFLTGHYFVNCFANLYRNEDDHIPWHADDDTWIGPVIASVSLGATRRFWLRRKDDHDAVIQGVVRHGDIVLMDAGCQDEWEHKIPKESTRREPRLNLTFRQMI